MAFDAERLAQAIDSKSMQEDDGRPRTLVMIGDPDSVKGSESVHSAPLNTARPRRVSCGHLVFRSFLPGSPRLADVAEYLARV